MKGSDKIIARLNELLAEELTATNQYILHSEMCANWGYERLHEVAEKRAIDEMKHAEKLIRRILFLEGQPIVSQLDPMHIGQDVQAQLNNDWAAERDAVRIYNESMPLCRAESDGGSLELLEDILEDEEQHIDWLETQIEQIKQLGLPNYLLGQIL